MDKTGERYAAARQALIEQALARQSTGRRVWAAEPETSDAAVVEATGRGYDEWCDLIDRWSGDSTDHTAVAAYVHQELGVDHWWAQTITVGYERITGLRLPYQRPDGTFTAGKSKTVSVETELLRKMLVDDGHRSDLFPGTDTELRSKPSAKVIRMSIGPGVALIGLDGVDPGRTKVSVQHEKLPTYDSVEEWKFYWSEWLDAIDDTD